MKARISALAVFAILLATCLWWLSSRGSRDLEPALEAADAGASASPAVPDTVDPISSEQGSADSDTGSTESTESRRAVAADDVQGASQAEQPITVLEVQAVDRAGHPLADISVEFLIDLPAKPRNVSEYPVKTGGGIKHRSKADVSEDGMIRILWTDSNGLASFRLLEPRLSSQRVRLSLRGSKTAAQRILEPPLASTRVSITLQACPRVEVTVLDESLRPRPGCYVDVRSWHGKNTDEAGQWRGSVLKFAKTDAAGLAVFDDLLPDEYAFCFDDPRSGTTSHELVHAELDGRYFVQLGSLSDPTKRACVSGWVIDEAGNPLPNIAVRLSIDAGPIASVRSDESGQFAYLCQAGREVELSVGGGMWDDDFEPSTLRVPFGTKDVRLRRVHQVEVISVEFVCLDATTGEVVPSKRLSGTRYRAGAPKDSASFIFVHKGRTSLIFRARDDWHVIINGRGYISQDIALADAMTHGPDGDRVVLRLQRTPRYDADIDKDQ